MVLYSKKVNLVMELCYSTALLRHTKTAIANTFGSSPLSDLNSWQIEWRRSSIWGRKLSLSVLFGVSVAKLVNFGLHMRFPDGSVHTGRGSSQHQLSPSQDLWAALDLLNLIRRVTWACYWWWKVGHSFLSEEVLAGNSLVWRVSSPY